jgi:lipopolysaccharide transport system ATP-binding protein
MANVAITTSSLGKQYVLGMRRRGYATLRESLGEAATGSLRRITGRRPRRVPRETLWALRDLSLEIRDGEVVGLIGHNGAGKSTLLKILGRITEPSAGWADVTGRVGSLLEVGTGFHPELTGRENIFLNGSILGMRRSEIRARFDKIVEFAEIERFLDTPVKRYSSGMSVRLAFSVAAHLEPEILLVDEVLAVGDASFQRKSIGKMNQVATDGRTVIFVSHNLAIIQALCQRGVLLARGQTVIDAPVDEAIEHYLRTLEAFAADDLLERTDRDQRGWLQARVRQVEICDASGRRIDLVVGGQFLRIVIHLTDVLPAMECRLTVLNSLGQAITAFDSEMPAPGDVRDPGLGPRIECDIGALPLVPGRYRIDVMLKGRSQIQDGLQAAAFFDVQSGMLGDRPMPSGNAEGDVVVGHTWRLPS